jgi:hypothetical protein
LDKVGFHIIIDGGVLKIRDGECRLLAKVIKSPNRLYVINVELAKLVCLHAKGSESAWLWHVRFGHLNFPALCKLAREGLVHGLPDLEQVDQVCSGCLAEKHRWASFPQQAEFKAKELLELVHGDLYDPISPTTPSGSRYFILLVDDHS